MAEVAYPAGRRSGTRMAVMTDLSPVQKEALSRGKLEAAVAVAGHIARPIASPDMGIDGDIEFFVNGRAMGARLAFQLKTGPSYVSSTSDTHYMLRVETKHLRYWCCVNLPVLLIYYDSTADALCWTDIKDWLLGSGFDPTAKDSTVVPVAKANTVPDGCTDKWRLILSLNTASQQEIQERFRLSIPELNLFRDPRFRPGVFSFSAERFVVADSVEPGAVALIELPPPIAPPLDLATTLVTVFSDTGESTGVLFTTLGSPEIPFNTMINDTVPIEMTTSHNTFYCRVNEGRPPVKVVCKGFGYATG